LNILTKNRLRAFFSQNIHNGDAHEPSLKIIEDIYLNELMNTADAQEGLKAFLEKRKPEWKNE